MRAEKFKFVLMRKIAYLLMILFFAAVTVTGCKSYKPHKDAYNPYLDKVKTKPSRELARENKRIEKRTVKASRKKMKESSTKLYGKGYTKKQKPK